MLAFWAACVAGGLLMLGLVLLDRQGPLYAPGPGFEADGRSLRQAG